MVARMLRRVLTVLVLGAWVSFAWSQAQPDTRPADDLFGRVLRRSLAGESSLAQCFRRDRFLNTTTPIYEIMEQVRTAESFAAAAEWFAVPHGLVERVRKEMLADDMRWERLSLEERYRLLDFVLLCRARGQSSAAGRVGELAGASTRRFLKEVAAMEADDPGRPLAVTPVLSLGPRSIAVVTDRMRGTLRGDRVDSVEMSGLTARGWPAGPLKEGIWDIAAAPPGDTPYVLVRHAPMNATQEPSTLFQADGASWRRVDVPLTGELRAVGVSDDGQVLAVGTENRKVMLRRKGVWTTQASPFAEPIDRLLFRGRDLVAVSHHGGVARLGEGMDWRVIRHPGEQVARDVAAGEAGVFLLLADGTVEAIGDDAKPLGNAVRPFAADDRGRVVPRHLILWAGRPCVVGSLPGWIVVVDVMNGEVWCVDPASAFAVAYIGVAPWSDTELMVYGGWLPLICNRNGEAAPCKALMEILQINVTFRKAEGPVPAEPRAPRELRLERGNAGRLDTDLRID